jgi:hypothetical protein
MVYTTEMRRAAGRKGGKSKKHYTPESLKAKIEGNKKGGFNTKGIQRNISPEGKLAQINGGRNGGSREKHFIPGARVKPLDLSQFFNDNVIKNNSCWDWKGRVNNKGYGYFCHGNKKHLVHRLSWELHNGPIPAGLEVCHKCDNPICSNPSHLFVATHSENMHDMIRKGRAKFGRKSKL